MRISSAPLNRISPARGAKRDCYRAPAPSVAVFPRRNAKSTTARRLGGIALPSTARRSSSRAPAPVPGANRSRRRRRHRLRAGSETSVRPAVCWRRRSTASRRRNCRDVECVTLFSAMRRSLASAATVLASSMRRRTQSKPLESRGQGTFFAVGLRRAAVVHHRRRLQSCTQRHARAEKASRGSRFPSPLAKTLEVPPDRLGYRQACMVYRSYSAAPPPGRKYRYETRFAFRPVMMQPSVSASSVWSRPMPTFSPGATGCRAYAQYCRARHTRRRAASPQALALRVAPVARRAACFLMCHRVNSVSIDLVMQLRDEIITRWSIAASLISAAAAFFFFALPRRRLLAVSEISDAGQRYCPR